MKSRHAQQQHEREVLPSPQRSGRKRGRDSSGGGRGVKLYCVCRQPDDGTPMYRCDGCKEWFHGRCVDINVSKLRNKKAQWYCPGCTRAAKEAAAAAAAAAQSTDKTRAAAGKDGVRKRTVESFVAAFSAFAEQDRVHASTAIAVRPTSVLLEQRVCALAGGDVATREYVVRARALCAVLLTPQNTDIRVGLLKGFYAPDDIAALPADKLDERIGPAALASVLQAHTDAATAQAAAAAFATGQIGACALLDDATLASFVEAASAAAAAASEAAEPPKKHGREYVWAGAVKCVGLGQFHVAAQLVCGEADLVAALPECLLVERRLALSKLQAYLYRCSVCSSRKRCVMRLDAAEAGSDVLCYNSLHRYFMGKHRAGFVALEGGKSACELLYMVPLQCNATSLPAFISQDATAVSNKRVVTAGAQKPRFLLVLVGRHNSARRQGDDQKPGDETTEES